MDIRYFKINKFDRKVVIGDTEYKFQKTSKNFASGGYNGILELKDGAEADALAERAADFGVFEVTEDSAIADIQKKRSSINRVEYQNEGSQKNVKPAEVKPKAEEPVVDSVDELISPADVEPEPEPAPTPKKRRARKTSKK